MLSRIVRFVTKETRLNKFLIFESFFVLNNYIIFGRRFINGLNLVWKSFLNSDRRDLQFKEPEVGIIWGKTHIGNEILTLINLFLINFSCSIHFQRKLIADFFKNILYFRSNEIREFNIHI